jgi:branched-chain amino acid transport system substrate-binding protein
VLVVDEDTPFYRDFVSSLRGRLGSAYVADTIKVGHRTQDTIDKVRSSGAKAVFYAGATADLAGNTLKVLRTSGLTVPFVGISAALDSSIFFKSADTNAAGAVTIQARAGSGTPAFNDAFKRRFGTEPNIASAPAYEAANIYLAGIDAGKRTGPALAEFVASYNRDGYRFDANGALAAEKALVYALTASTTAFPDTGDRIPLS